jgi:hypothetical protein
MMFSLFVSGFIAFFVGGPVGYVLWRHIQEQQFKERALDYGSYSEPIPFGVADGFSQEVKTHLDGFESEKKYRYPDELKRDNLFKLDEPGMPLPNITPTHLPTDAPTQPPTDEPTWMGTGNRTGVTHGPTSESTFQPSFGNASDDLSADISETFPKVSGSLSAKEALQLEREIKAFAPYPIDADDPDSLFAVESALKLEKPKAWMCKELFGGIKPGGNKDYQAFNELLEKANG